MGLITYGVPAEYVLSLKQRFGIDCFVETGTSAGKTADWAAWHFKQVITIELSPQSHHRASARLAYRTNVRQILGSSPEVLAGLARSLPPAIFWLDAHWDMGDQISKDRQCPLLEEIAALAPCWEQAFVLVDDASLFLSPPPAGYDQSQWPSLGQVVNALGTGHDRFVACFEDVFVSLPAEARDVTLDYVRAGGDRNSRVLGRDANPVRKTSRNNGRVAAREQNRVHRGRSASPGGALETLVGILRIGKDVERTEKLLAAIREGRVSWEATIALAELHLLLPALWPALLEKKLAEPVPPTLRRFLIERERNPSDGSVRRNVFMFLEDRFDTNSARNRLIRAQLAEIIGALNAAGVVPGLIKGARLLLAGDWRYVAGRTLRDIDLLLAPGDWTAGVEAMRSVGYLPIHGDYDQPRQGAALVKRGAPAEIDLHSTPLTLHEPVSLPSYLTAAGFWERAATIADEGLVYRLLPAAEALVHGILHTEIADLNYAAGDWTLRYLHETAVLSRDPAVDWSVLAALAGTPLSRPLEAHLLAARDLFGAALPEGFASSPAARRQFLRCQRNITHPRSWRRLSMLGHKFRQAMSEWYLRRMGYFPQTGGTRAELWRGRLWVLRDLVRIHGLRLLRRPFGGDGDPLPPPRV